MTTAWADLGSPFDSLTSFLRVVVETDISVCAPDCKRLCFRRERVTVLSLSESAPSNGHRIDRSGEPLIRAEGVWKIFGPHAERIVGTEDADLPRGELQKKTGCVAAVRDVSFSVWPGEVFVVMGLSGSGESTVIRTLIRQNEATARPVNIAGPDGISADV